jgi:hypothetical protein
MVSASILCVLMKLMERTTSSSSETGIRSGWDMLHCTKLTQYGVARAQVQEVL